MAIPIGRLGQVYLKLEAAYGTAEALVAANGLRHENITFAHDPFNRVTSPEKRQSPDPVDRFDRKKSAGLGTLVALMRPSGALNTLAEIDPVLEATFGSKTNVTLDTTVSASPSPTTTGCTVASAGALAKGDAVLITVTGQANSPFVRILTDVTGAALTWAPALPAAPTTGDALKAGTTYKLTNALAKSLTITHYVDSFKRALLGAAIDSLALSMDGNSEMQATASGPAADQITAATQAEPATFTRVGGNPPSALDGEVLIDDIAYLVKNFGLSLTNGLVLRNTEIGVNAASEVYRSSGRNITVSLDAYAETEATLYDKAEAGTNVSVFVQTGRTEGNIIGVYLPKVEFKPGETDDPDEEVSWSFSDAMALATADGENDSLRLALM